MSEDLRAKQNQERTQVPIVNAGEKQKRTLLSSIGRFLQKLLQLFVPEKETVAEKPEMRQQPRQKRKHIGLLGLIGQVLKLPLKLVWKYGIKPLVHKSNAGGNENKVQDAKLGVPGKAQPNDAPAESICPIIHTQKYGQQAKASLGKPMEANRPGTERAMDMKQRPNNISAKQEQGQKQNRKNRGQKV